MYTCLIKTCIKAHKIEKAFRLYDHLKSENIMVDAIIFAKLIEGCISKRLYKQAALLLIDCLMLNCTPSKELAKLVCDKCS